jgi:hypothetical protein
MFSASDNIPHSKGNQEFARLEGRVCIFLSLAELGPYPSRWVERKATMM